MAYTAEKVRKKEKDTGKSVADKKMDAETLRKLKRLALLRKKLQMLEEKERMEKQRAVTRHGVERNSDTMAAVSQDADSTAVRNPAILIDKILEEEPDEDLPDEEEFMKMLEEAGMKNKRRAAGIRGAVLSEKTLKPGDDLLLNAEKYSVDTDISGSSPIDTESINLSDEELLKEINKFGPLTVPSVDSVLPDTLIVGSDVTDALASLKPMPTVAKREVYPELCRLHPWLEDKSTEFMYSIPDKKRRPNDFADWQEDWTAVMFDYARLTGRHILFVPKLIGEPPWSKFRNRKLSVILIGDGLVEKGLAKWYDRRKEQLRVYWKTHEEWADEILRWIIDDMEGVTSSEEIKRANMPFSDLPDEDLKIIFGILKKRKGVSVKKKGKVYIINAEDFIV